MENELHAIATRFGADFFGIADLSPAHPFILDQGGAAVAAFPRAVSIGIALPHSLVDPLPAQSDPVVIMNYNLLAYDVINDRLDQLVSILSAAIQPKGYRAMPVAASQRANDEKLAGIISNKLAASLCGLGWIGKSCLLVTPQAGPRVRWATVLTSAPLQPTGRMIEQHCGSCHACVDICPVSAFTGVPFNPNEPREIRYDAHRCAAYLERRKEETGYKVCGLCLYACPHGKQAAKKLR